MPCDRGSRQTSRPLLRRVDTRSLLRHCADAIIKRLPRLATAVVPEGAGPMVVREDCGRGPVLPRVLCREVAGKTGPRRHSRRVAGEGLLAARVDAAPVEAVPGGGVGV